MNTEHQDIWDVISSVMNGNPTMEEKKTFDEWVNENPKNKKFFDSITSDPFDKQYTSQDKKRIYLKVQSSIQQNSLRKRRFIIYSAAASIVALVAFSIFQFLLKSGPIDSVYQEAYTPNGVKSKIILADGTIVHMNSGSTLKYPVIFEGDNREVILLGEAYFEVAKNTERPFIVNAGKLQIQVLGTKFNVRNFDTEPTIETTLLEGSVAVYKKGTPVYEEKNILKPNELFAYEKNTGILKKQKIDGSLVTIWKDGKCFFYNETFSVIANKLQRSFNVNVKIESEDLKNEVFSGLFDKNRNIYQILDAMKKFRNFDYKTQKDTIVVYKKN